MENNGTKKNDLHGFLSQIIASKSTTSIESLNCYVVRRVVINDINRPVYAFWNSVLTRTDALCNLIEKTALTVEEWDRQKTIFRHHETADELDLGFAFFFLNRTNRSGILNGGVIGGRNQTGKWKIDARYNKLELISRIRKIAALRSRTELSCMDAQDFLAEKSQEWKSNTLVYIDPPYFEKGRYLYHDAYAKEDHASIAESIRGLDHVSWIVSYDDVHPIHAHYHDFPWLQYTLNYSAHTASRGREAMFFSQNLEIPGVCSPLIEIDRDARTPTRPLEARVFV